MIAGKTGSNLWQL